MKSISLVVYDISLTGGAEKVAINLANELSLYFDVTLISVFFEEGNTVSPLNEKVNLEVLSDSPKSLTFSLFTLALKLREIVVRRNITDIISITAGLNILIFVSTFFLKTRNIYTEHSNLLNNQYGFKHKLRQFIGAKFFDITVTLTSKDKQLFEEKFKVDNKVFVIPNWAEKTSRSITMYNNSKKIVSVGRLVQVKGYDRLIRVAHAILEKNLDWEWHIFGEGPERKNMEIQIGKLSTKSRIILKGNDETVAEKLNEYSLFVSTSTFEGLPLSFLEARNNLLPIVSFDCPTGPSDIISNGIDGYLIPCYDEEVMINKILYLINNEEKMKDLSKSINLNSDKFSKENIISKWLELLT